MKDESNTNRNPNEEQEELNSDSGHRRNEMVNAILGLEDQHSSHNPTTGSNRPLLDVAVERSSPPEEDEKKASPPEEDVNDNNKATTDVGQGTSACEDAPDRKTQSSVVVDHSKPKDSSTLTSAPDASASTSDVTPDSGGTEVPLTPDSGGTEVPLAGPGAWAMGGIEAGRNEESGTTANNNTTNTDEETPNTPPDVLVEATLVAPEPTDPEAVVTFAEAREATLSHVLRQNKMALAGLILLIVMAVGGLTAGIVCATGQCSSSTEPEFDLDSFSGANTYEIGEGAFQVSEGVSIGPGGEVQIGGVQIGEIVEVVPNQETGTVHHGSVMNEDDLND